MKETVDEVVKRFHAQMDHVPLLSLYDSDKDVALKAPTAYFKHHHTWFVYSVHRFISSSNAWYLLTLILHFSALCNGFFHCIRRSMWTYKTTSRWLLNSCARYYSPSPAPPTSAFSARTRIALFIWRAADSAQSHPSIHTEEASTLRWDHDNCQ